MLNRKDVETNLKESVELVKRLALDISKITVDNLDYLHCAQLLLQGVSAALAYKYILIGAPSK